MALDGVSAHGGGGVLEGWARKFLAWATQKQCRYNWGPEAICHWHLGHWMERVLCIFCIKLCLGPEPVALRRAVKFLLTPQPLSHLTVTDQIHLVLWIIIILLYTVVTFGFGMDSQSTRSESKDNYPPLAARKPSEKWNDRAWGHHWLAILGSHPVSSALGFTSFSHPPFPAVPCGHEAIW